VTVLDIPPVQYADEGGASVAFQIVGDGPIDLLVAPGFISHLDMQWTMPTFAAYVEQLAEFSRVILFDKRGTGLSDPSPEAARFDQRVDDISAVLDAAGSKRAVLLGMSEGGPLSVLYAATHPERVRALVLLGTFASGRSIGSDVLARFDHAVDHWGEGLTSEIFVSPDELRTFAKSYFGLFERASCSPGMARALLDSIKEVDVTEILPSLDVPTLLLHRRNDPFAAMAWTDELERLLRSPTRIELEGSSHLPWLGDSVSIAQAVAEFTLGARYHDSNRAMVATVLFTDIVDSTRRAVEMGDRDWRRLLLSHNDLVRGIFERYQGREIKALGDGFLCLFSTPGRGVRCAEEIVDAVRALGLEVRAGVHTGRVELIDMADVAGITVHVAARVGARAGAGEVLVTKAVTDLLVGDSLAFRSRGTPHLKGLPDRVGVFALTGHRPTPDVAGARLERAGDRITLGALASVAKVRRSLNRLVTPLTPRRAEA
jgi:pimeloyl-ACP methyl ester carboxylesterase